MIWKSLTIKSISMTLAAGFLIAGSPSFATAAHHTTLHHAPHKSASKAHKIAAPAAMSTERATQIQAALIKAGYLQGEPTGVWDAQTTAAMQKLQKDNGWQTKITPDSRALIKLGLGSPTAQTASMQTTFQTAGS